MSHWRRIATRSDRVQRAAEAGLLTFVVWRNVNEVSTRGPARWPLRRHILAERLRLGTACNLLWKAGHLKIGLWFRT
jgi:hypothetical protein